MWVKMGGKFRKISKWRELAEKIKSEGRFLPIERSAVLNKKVVENEKIDRKNKVEMWIKTRFSQKQSEQARRH